MKKLILILATPFLLFSHASYANTGNNISDFAQRVASEIGQHTDYILENEDRRMLLSTTIGLYSTIFGANAVTMLPGSYTLVGLQT